MDQDWAEGPWKAQVAERPRVDKSVQVSFPVDGFVAPRARTEYQTLETAKPYVRKRPYPEVGQNVHMRERLQLETLLQTGKRRCDSFQTPYPYPGFVYSNGQTLSTLPTHPSMYGAFPMQQVTQPQAANWLPAPQPNTSTLHDYSTLYQQHSSLYVQPRLPQSSICQAVQPSPTSIDTSAGDCACQP
ncbi:hypothetical protein XELAEV_18021828mg [Xenopus laevis]|uniref:Uncharacterized protein n=1 Tax=Xenopus laevis TaxID=8355 RepID=A0A974HN15_XENLA|nr:hypothetical protein XELAEV_18021828mg [Xenopus laevis]